MVKPGEESPKRHPFEYRLDNAALIFPAMLSRRRSTILRLSAEIDRPVDIALLQGALDRMAGRCPYYQVHLRRGLFWYYLEQNDTPPVVEAESRYPCLYLPYKKAGVLPFRVLAYRNRIAFEVAHFLTDGNGALRFLNGLILEYLRMRGERIDSAGMVIDCRGFGGSEEIAESAPAADPGEFEDSFQKYFAKGVPPAKQEASAFQLRGTGEEPPVYHIIEGRIKSGDLKAEAVRRGVTIGELLTALLIDVCREEMGGTAEGGGDGKPGRQKPVRVTVPIDLRRMFPSSTMRNFVLTVEPGIDFRLGDFSFDEILARVYHFMRLELDKRMIMKQLARNVAWQKNLFFRMIPLFLKDPLFRFVYSVFGRRASTVSFSNLGRVELPEKMAPFVRSYQFIPLPQSRNSSVTAIAWNGYTSIIFGSTLKESSLERRFFTRLRRMGIRVSVRTNRR